jgi:hypothetical protein
MSRDRDDLRSKRIGERLHEQVGQRTGEDIGSLSPMNVQHDAERTWSRLFQ